MRTIRFVSTWAIALALQGGAWGQTSTPEEGAAAASSPQLPETVASNARPASMFALSDEWMARIRSFFQPRFTIVHMPNVRPELLGAALAGKNCMIYSNQNHPVIPRISSVFQQEVIPLYFAHEVAHCEILGQAGWKEKDTELYADLRALEFAHAQGRAFMENNVGPFLALRFVGVANRDEERASPCELLVLNEFAARPYNDMDMADRLDAIEFARFACRQVPDSGVARAEAPAQIVDLSPVKPPESVVVEPEAIVPVPAEPTRVASPSVFIESEVQAVNSGAKSAGDAPFDALFNPYPWAP